MADTVIVISAKDDASDTIQSLSGVFSKLGADIESGLGMSLQKVGGYFTTFLGAAGVAASVGGLWSIASQWDTMTFQMSAVFQDRAAEMIQTARDLSDKTGHYFSTIDFAGALAHANDQFERFGLTGEEQISIVARAADLAAVRGLSLEDAITKVTRALEGQGRAGMALGLSMKDNYMQNIAFDGSLKDIWGSLSEVEKEGLRTQEFFNQTSKYMDEAAAKAQTLAGGMTALGNTIKNLMALSDMESRLLHPGAGITPTAPADLAGTIADATLNQAALDTAKARVGINAQMLEQLGNMAGLQKQLNEWQSEYLGRNATTAAADAQRNLNMEVNNEVVIKGQLKNLDKDRVTYTNEIKGLESQINAVMQFEPELVYHPSAAQVSAMYSNALGQAASDAVARANVLSSMGGLGAGPEIEQAAAERNRLLDQELAAELKIVDIDRQKKDMEQEILDSKAKQNAFETASVRTLEDEVSKMATAAQAAGAPAAFASPVMQKDETSLLNARNDAQKKANDLLLEQWQIQQKLDRGELEGQQYTDAQKRLQDIQTQLDQYQGIVQQISTLLAGIQQKYQETISGSIEFKSLNKNAADFQAHLEQLSQSPIVIPGLLDVAIKFDKMQKDTAQIVINLNAAAKSLENMGAGHVTTSIEQTGAAAPTTMIGNAPLPPGRAANILGLPDPSAYTDYGKQASQFAIDGWNSILQETDQGKKSLTLDIMTSDGIKSVPLNQGAELIKQNMSDLPVSSPFDVDTANATQHLTDLQNQLNALVQTIEKGATFTINAMLAMSPAQPFSEGVSKMGTLLLALPQSMELTVNAWMAGGDSISTALSKWQALEAYLPVLYKYQAYQQVATENVSSFLSSISKQNAMAGQLGMVDISQFAQVKANAAFMMDQMQSQYYQAYLEYESAMGKGPGGHCHRHGDLSIQHRHGGGCQQPAGCFDEHGGEHKRDRGRHGAGYGDYVGTDDSSSNCVGYYKQALADRGRADSGGNNFPWLGRVEHGHGIENRS